MRTALSCLFILACTQPVVSAQSNLDSLEKAAARQTGKEKALTLSELCFQYSGSHADKAIAYGIAAVRESEKTGDSLLVAQTMNDLSIGYLMKGNYDSVIVLNEKAYGIRIRKNEKALAAASLAKISSAYYWQGQLDKSLKLNFDVLKLYEELKDEKNLAKITNNIGNLYEKNLNLNEAINWYNKAIKHCENAKDYYALINAKANVAAVMQKQKKFAEAEKIFLELIPTIEEHGTEEQLSGVYQGLGVIYRERRDHHKGLEYYEKALEIYRRMNSEAGMASILINIGNTHADLKEFDKAEKNLQEGLALSQKNNSLSQLENAYGGLYLLEKKRGNALKALAYLETYNHYHDSVYNAKSNELLAEMNARYQSQQKEKALLVSEAQLAETRLAISQRNMWIAIISSLVAGLAILLLFLRSQYKIRQNRLKQESKLQLERERLRISRDLHDNLGADLTWISSELDTKAYTVDNKALQKDFTAIGDKTRGAMKSLRETIWAIHNEQTTPQEIVSRIREQTKQILQNQGISLETNVQGEPVLGPNHTLHLYRICKEAINNSVKHSGCTAIHIDSHVNGNTLALKIRDNGKGLDIKNPAKGYGLNNIEQRTQEMGGSLIIDSDSSGTCVQIKIPLTINGALKNKAKA